MVSRVPQYGEVSTNAAQGNGAQAQPKEGKGQGHGTPRQLKKEASTPKPAQDVAELKDYVCYSITFSLLVQNTKAE